jgi:DNA primase
MDFLSLYQSGIKNAVAASGTSFTKDHALLLRRYADSVTLLFDADAAGISAAERCAEHLFAVELDVRVACLPTGDDPDSFIRREGSESLTELIRNAGSYFRFMRDAADPPYESRNRAGQQALLKSQLRLVGLIADEVLRALMLKEISNVYGISEEILSRSIKPEKPKKPMAAYAGRIASSRNELEEEIVRLLLSNPHLIERVTDEIDPDGFSDDHLGDILRAAMELYGKSSPESYFSKLVDRIESDESRQTLTRLMNSGQEFGDPETTLSEYMTRLREVYRDVQLSEYMARLRDAKAAGDNDEIEELLSKINRLRQET